MWNDRYQLKEGNIGGAMGFAGGAGGSGFGDPSAPNQQGMDNLQNSYAQLQQVSTGQGPNPAMEQYNQNVQDLAKQQAGAIGSIQGISPALAARMSSQQGSAAMQNAAAGGATTHAQQQLGAMGTAAQTAGQQAGAFNQMQLGLNSNNTSMAQTQMQRGLLGGALGSIGSVFAKGGVVGGYADGGPVAGGDPFSYGAPQSKFGQYLMGVNSSGAPVAGGNGIDNGPDKKGAQQLMAGIGSAIMRKKPKALPNAGQGPTMDNLDGMTDDTIPYNTSDYGAGLSGAGGDAAAGAADAGGAEAGAAEAGAADAAGAAGAEEGGGEALAALLAKGGQVQAAVSPGEVYIPPGKIKQAAHSQNPLASGTRFPGKPKVKGDSYANDVVPAKLEKGGIVIPNSVMQSKNPPKAAHDFIANVIAKHRGRK